MKFSRRLDALERRLTMCPEAETGPILLVSVNTREEVAWLRALPPDVEYVEAPGADRRKCVSFRNFAARLLGDISPPPGVPAAAWHSRPRPEGQLVRLDAFA